MKMPRPFAGLSLAVALSLALGSCTTNPATGQREFTPFMTRGQEAAIGAEQHPVLTAEFGGEISDPDLTAYVRNVGRELSTRSELPELDFTFTVVNSKIVNAFALPGGYVYVSRGLLALFNDESELSSVLGHEIGHVTARHSANRYNRSVLAGLGTAIIGVVSGSTELAGLVGQGSQLYLLSYSRNQEMQSDMLGQRYMTRVGYDPMGAARMLSALDRHTQLQAAISGVQASQTPSWARTHPYAKDRAVAATQRVSDLPADQQSGARNRARFLAAIDGMLFGDDPAQGLIRDQTFTHPDLRIRFSTPDDFAMRNTSEAVLGSSQSGARFMLTASQISSETSTAEFMDAEWRRVAGDAATPLSNVQRVSGDGLERTTATTRVRTESASLDVRTYAIRQTPTRAYQFTLIWPSGGGAGLERSLVGIANSFRGITEAEAAAVRALRIRIVTVRAGETATALAARMPFGEHNLNWFAILNALPEGAPLSAGQQVKIVVED